MAASMLAAAEASGAVLVTASILYGYGPVPSGRMAEDLPLARETLAGIGPYLDHPRCVAVGEIGFNRITPNEEAVFLEQLELAKKHNLLVLIHTPHDTPEVSKKAGTARILDILREFNYDTGRIIVDHNTEDTMPLTRKTDYWAGLTVYPYSKLNPRRVVELGARTGQLLGGLGSIRPLLPAQDGHIHGATGLFSRASDPPHARQSAGVLLPNPQVQSPPGPALY